MVKSTVEQSKCSLRLIVGDFVSSFVDAKETEVAVLTYFAVFGAVDGEGFVARCGKFFAVGVV
jgi:predicted phosphodiesterase